MAIGYKEWLDVCSMLGAGGSSVLLRKGGIHEGSEGFSFKHDGFFLFPTGFHQQADGLVGSAPPTDQPAATAENGVTMRHFAVAAFARLVRDRNVIEALAAHHVWAPAVVWERYSYSEKLEADCLSVACVRVYRLSADWHIPYQPGYGGCRSWVELPEPPTGWREAMRPVLADDAHLERERQLRALLGID